MRQQVFRALNLLHPVFLHNYKNRLRVLAYHNVPDQVIFKKQVDYLVNHYNIISVEELLQSIVGNQRLPDNPLLITFDDGDITVYNNGLPVLREYNIPSCLFIITSLIGSKEEVWIQRVQKSEMEKGLSYTEARSIIAEMKKIPNSQRVQRTSAYPVVEKEQLTEAQVYELEKNHCYVANHTHTHPMLDQCDPEEIQEELDRSKAVFEDLGIAGFDVFAYPNGNQDQKTRQVLEKNQMRLVFLFDHKINRIGFDPLEVSRIKVDADDEIEEFKAKVSGIHPFLFHMRNPK